MGNGSLQGKVAIVTGGASGIGGAVTRLFAERGARVVVVDLQREAGEALALELGDAVVFRQGDVSDRDVADGTVAAAVERFGRLDTLINNASASRQKPFEEQTDDDWRLAMDSSTMPSSPTMKSAARAAALSYTQSRRRRMGLCYANGFTCGTRRSGPCLRGRPCRAIP